MRSLLTGFILFAAICGNCFAAQSNSNKGQVVKKPQVVKKDAAAPLPVPNAFTVQRLEYKNIAANDDSDKIKELLKFECSSITNKQGILEGSCRKPFSSNEHFSLAGAKTSAPYFRLLDNRVSMIFVHISPEDFLQISDALIEKYGKPFKIENEELVTRMGVKYQNSIYVWESKEAILEIKKYSSSVDEGIFTLTSKTLLKMEEENQKKAAKTNINDL